MELTLVALHQPQSPWQLDRCTGSILDGLLVLELEVPHDAAGDIRRKVLGFKELVQFLHLPLVRQSHGVLVHHVVEQLGRTRGWGWGCENGREEGGREVRKVPLPSFISVILPIFIFLLKSFIRWYSNQDDLMPWHCN